MALPILILLDVRINIFCHDLTIFIYGCIDCVYKLDPIYGLMSRDI